MPYPGFKKNRDREQSTDDWRLEEDKLLGKTPVDTKGQTETFFTANVKLITAVVTILVILALIGPWSVFKIIEWYDATQEETVEVLITEQDFDRIVARGSELNWVDFDGFTYEVVSDDYAYICQYDVEGDRYYFWVTSKEKGSRVESVLLIDKQNGYEETEIKATE